MAQPPHNQCDQCLFWNKGYLLQGFRVPATCNKHFHLQAGDDPACKDFSSREDEHQ